MGIELFGPVCTSCWLGLIGSGQWRWSHSFDSLTENLLESHVSMQPTQTGGWRGMWLFTLWCQCQEVWLWVVFLPVTEKPPAVKSRLSYRHSTPVGAKFCLIWHSLSKPAMFLSSALLLLAACFTGTICLKTLKPQSRLSPRKAPVKDATFAPHLPASPPAGQSDFLGSALLSIPLPLGKTILKITRFLCLLTPFLLFM